MVDGSGLVGKRRLVNAFGQGSVGQLGNGHTVSSRVPGEVLVNQASAVSMGDGSLGTSVDLEFGVKRIFAGGDQSFASVEPLVCCLGVLPLVCCLGVLSWCGVCCLGVLPGCVALVHRKLLQLVWIVNYSVDSKLQFG